jgi:hypothetical protein
MFNRTKSTWVSVCSRMDLRQDWHMAAADEQPMLRRFRCGVFVYTLSPILRPIQLGRAFTLTPSFASDTTDWTIAAFLEPGDTPGPDDKRFTPTRRGSDITDDSLDHSSACPTSRHRGACQVASSWTAMPHPRLTA